MTKDEALGYIDDARNLLDKIYYYVSEFIDNNEHMELLELQRQLSWCDTCALEAGYEIEKHFKE